MRRAPLVSHSGKSETSLHGTGRGAIIRAMRALIVAICAVAAMRVGAAPAQEIDLVTVLHRAGERVERFFARAQSIVCLEVVHLMPLTSTWSVAAPSRTVESELRLSWDAGLGEDVPSEAQTQRRLLKVNGRQPRKDDSRSCTTPEQQSEETQPLSMLLPSQRDEHDFTFAGETRLDGRPALMVDYRVVRNVTVESSMVEGRDDCVSFDIDGGMRGRLWIDRETYDVLRMDRHLVGMVEIPLPDEAQRWANLPVTWTMERWDTEIRFKAVKFENPDETLILPESLSSLRITRGAGTPRLRTMTNYKNYQRFLTGGRVIGD